MSPGRLLLVDDDEEACRLLGEVLEREGYDVEQESSAPVALARLGEETFDAVLTDLRMPGASGIDLVRAARLRDPGTVVFVLTGFGDAHAAGEAIRAGAHDFLSKPYDLDQLRETLERALGRRHRAGPADAEPLSTTATPTLVGRSTAIIDVMKTIARAAPSHANVLIFGETGTGKELVARELHRLSGRAKGKFVAVNCSALAEGLLESELFGHVRGAFTGATNARPGLIREANGGTLFLDEIGDISAGLQARLLRVLQEREVLPVGSESPVTVDLRVVAATHRDLPAMVAEGKFREDLFYRLNVVTVELPPLRERRQDIPLLVDHVLRGLAQRDGRLPVAVDRNAFERLRAYAWPGNVRELVNVLERAMVLAAQDVIGLEHLPVAVRSAAGTPTPVASNDSGVTLTLADVEKAHVLAALDRFKGNREQTARALGIARRTLLRMLQRWGLQQSL